MRRRNAGRAARHCIVMRRRPGSELSCAIPSALPGTSRAARRPAPWPRPASASAADCCRESDDHDRDCEHREKPDEARNGRSRATAAAASGWVRSPRLRAAGSSACAPARRYSLQAWSTPAPAPELAIGSLPCTPALGALRGEGFAISLKAVAKPLRRAGAALRRAVSPWPGASKLCDGLVAAGDVDGRHCRAVGDRRA